MAVMSDCSEEGELTRLKKSLEQEKKVRLEAEEALLKAQIDLERRILERTAELEESSRALQAQMSECKQADLVLRESEERYRTLVEHTYDLIAETGSDGRFLYVSRKHEEALGYEPSELVGNSIFLHMHPDDSPTVMAEFMRALRTISSGQAVHRYRHKNGQWRWLESTGKPFRTATGEIRAVIASRDITERKEAEEKQMKLLKELESANQELRDFAYIVSHDLKAPLRAINSLAGWLATDYADNLDKEGKEQLDLLVARVRRMNNLIDGVLRYSRTGRVKEEKVRVDLNELVQEIIYLIALPSHINVKIEKELPSILCERTRMEQVFQNLISNAVKFMDKPRGEIKVACAQEDSHWRFSVADNGPGIEEKYFEKIFQIFQTLASRDESENTGVGLAIVKKIIDTYRGKIWVESMVGYGSTFFFTLPKC